MKSCPYCKEEINAEAIKCRFCQSMLLPVSLPEQSKADADRITYVLDRDLVRFGKFAGAALGVFLIVGAYLFGFKLDSALDRVHSTQEELRGTHEKLTVAQSDLKAAQDTVRGLKKDVEAVVAEARGTVRGLKKEVEAVLAEARGTLGEISAQKAAAVALVVSIRELSPPELLALQKAKAEQPDKIRRGSGQKFWANGATIRVKFLDGDAQKQSRVAQIAQEWTAHANLTFQVVTSGDSEIRVSFKKLGSWSFLGTDALAVPQDQPTINFEWVEQQNVLHEFGHAIGLVEELANPRATIRWNKALVYKSLAGPPNFWSRENIDRNLFGQVPAAQLGEYRQFDPKSIMTMQVPKEWTGGVEVGGSDELSDSDKALVRRIYPRGS